MKDTITTGREYPSLVTSESRDREGDQPDVSDLLVQADSSQVPVLSVIMPTLNEEKGVFVCIQKIKQAILELGVPTEIIISDSSTDRTPEIARHEGAIVVEPTEMGYGNAYRYAFERARGEYIAMGDADVTYDFTSIPKLLAPIRDGRADMVLGSRLNGTIESGSMPLLHKYVGNPFLTWFLNMFYDAGVSDAHSGFRVFTRAALDRLELSSGGMEFASEMLMEASVKGLRIEEVPIVYHEREGDATLHSFRDGWRHVRFMLVNTPGHIFSLPGTALAVVGLVSLVLSVSGTQIGQYSPGVLTTVAGGLALITGFQFWCLAVFSATADTGIRAPSDRLTQWAKEHVRLEHGMSLGVGVSALGLAYLGSVFLTWATTGYTALPSLKAIVVAFISVVLGTQIMSSSFFLSALGSAE
ncbi:dolichyl-phosphate beta-D-mannosyltransferase [Halorubrum coriense DSM 10284]|uniref:Dolichyl-phosphate beta-D-mannosyltransferase n=1 Tax=Halorubrum coriense DSM 10284 TaxID=1227466 RepID=M0EGN9_9EURY|nr:glycosyltransferase family 2 protein [Halorubrum coriense]ELZ46946.1 dolichyl-phosphate beta-D-mannosyltransferase [Halorubrum coriense DSM 10284]